MNCMIFIYKWTSRELKKIIVAILKSWIANNVKKINYVQNYSINEKNIKKSEEKILLIYSDNQDKLLNFIAKNFPQIVRINII